jgi:hypothetical protein
MKSIFSGVLLSVVLSTCLSCTKKTGPALFTKLDSTQTGISFVNQVVGTAKLNILEYLYFYNGGGVSAGDVNNDGKPDLYFVSNQGKNRLYLNKTEPGQAPAFDDITEQAGVAGFSDWQTGVTMADVNGDGLLDIYVCAVGNYKGLEGNNELYINNGNGPDGRPTFSEKAAEYGLDFTGFSTQAAFFDYDHDGDLDCFLLNHAVHTSRSYDRAATRTTRQPESGDYLFENPLISAGPLTPARSVKFNDISEQAGIYGAAMGYGLGVSVADLNNDGWEDIYVSNDFHENDYYYVNKGNKQTGGPAFTESAQTAFAHVSRFSMGNDIGDVNNDGFPDVMTLDMYPADETVEKSSQGEDLLDIYLYKLSYGYMNQYSRNCLQLNLGGKRFIDVGTMAGVAATDWSWSPLLADYDNDGIKDLFIANGIPRRPNNLDYIKYVMNDSIQMAMTTSQAVSDKAIALMPEGKVHNYLYRGTPDLQFEDKSLDWGFDQTGISNGATYADLDNDGDLDLITNDMNEPGGVYLNQANKLFPDNHYLRVSLKGNKPNTFGVGAKVILKTKNGLQLQQLMPTHGFESSVEPVLTFGLGKQTVIDSLIVVWPDQRMEIRTRVKANQQVVLQQAQATINAGTYQFTPQTPALFSEVTDQYPIAYTHRENTDYYDFFRESLIPFKVSTEGPKLAVGDVNGDGLDDFYAGGGKWQAGSLHLQQANGQFSPSRQSIFLQDSLSEDVDAAFFDADGDKDLDLYVVSGGNEFSDKAPQLLDHLYLNDGTGQFSRSTGLPPMYDNKSCVRVSDVDGDGDLDLFVGGRVQAQAYGKSPRSYLLINDGRGRFSDKTDQLAPQLRRAGMITDAIWADLDKDKRPELIVVGDWMPIRIFTNQGGKLVPRTNIAGPDAALTGFWQCVAAADFDGDGDLDLVAGNLGLNNKFNKQPSPELAMWLKDIDGNQTTDHILAYKRTDNDGNPKWYPVAFKDELSKQMPGIINRKFTNYQKIAGKTIDEIFDEGELDNADKYVVNQFASVYLDNQNGQFVVKPLPMLAQVSKLFSLAVTDIDNDGKPDLLAGGNFYGVSTYQGRYDADYGLVLRNQTTGRDAKTPFTALTSDKTGFALTGEVRDIKSIKTANGLRWLVARNNASLQIFAPARPGKAQHVTP